MNLKISSFCTQKIQVHKEICCNLKMITRQLENAERISWLQRYIFLPGYLKSFFSFLSFTYLPHCFAPKIMAAKIWCGSADPPRIRANDGSKESSDRELSNEPSFARFHGGSALPHQIVAAMISLWEQWGEVGGDQRERKKNLSYPGNLTRPGCKNLLVPKYSQH